MRDGLQRTAAHAEQAGVILFVETIAAADVADELSLLRLAVDAVGFLLMVQLAVELEVTVELVAQDKAAAPVVRHGVIAEPVADFAVVVQPSELARNLD